MKIAVDLPKPKLRNHLNRLAGQIPDDEFHVSIPGNSRKLFERLFHVGQMENIAGVIVEIEKANWSTLTQLCSTLGSLECETVIASRDAKLLNKASGAIKKNSPISLMQIAKSPDIWNSPSHQELSLPAHIKEMYKNGMMTENADSISIQVNPEAIYHEMMREICETVRDVIDDETGVWLQVDNFTDLAFNLPNKHEVTGAVIKHDCLRNYVANLYAEEAAEHEAIYV